MSISAKDVKTNPHFCPVPWTGLMYNFNGVVKNCIRGNSYPPIGDIKVDEIENILHSRENLTRQNLILDKQPVPSCRNCKELEREKTGFNIISDRVFYIKELKQTPLETYTSGNFDLKTVDIRWTNLCNFACVYCTSEYSSKWASELGIKYHVPSEEQKQKFKNYILDNAPNLKHVYLAGGEPLLMKENLDLLKKLDPNVNIRINTNLSKVDTKVFDAVCSFKNVHWTVSGESLTEEFNYIRYGGNWEDFLENLDIIKKLGHKISFNMLWFLLNYRSVFDFVDFMQARGFHNNSFIIGALLLPLHLNIRHLPNDVLDSLKQTLEDRISASPGFLLEDSYRNMLHYINTPFDKNLSNAFAELEKLDQRRNLNSSTIFKDLYNLKKD